MERAVIVCGRREGRAQSEVAISRSRGESATARLHDQAQEMRGVHASVIFAVSKSRNVRQDEGCFSAHLQPPRAEQRVRRRRPRARMMARRCATARACICSAAAEHMLIGGDFWRRQLA